jgi:hypothetical protein
MLQFLWHWFLVVFVVQNIHPATLLFFWQVVLERTSTGTKDTSFGSLLVIREARRAGSDLSYRGVAC